MKAIRTVSALLFLGILGAQLGAQAKPLEKPQAGQKPAAVQPKEAAAKADEVRALTFAVTGLTKDNLAHVKESLQGMTLQAYTCAPCAVSQATAGECPKCKAALKHETHPEFSQVQPSAETGMIALTIDPLATVKLSELEAALARNMVKVDGARFPIAGRAHLVLRGVTAEAAPAIEKALSEAKLFEEVKAKFDASTNELRVLVRAGPSAPTRAKVATALEATKAQIADVVWGPRNHKS